MGMMIDNAGILGSFLYKRLTIFGVSESMKLTMTYFFNLLVTNHRH